MVDQGTVEKFDGDFNDYKTMLKVKNGF